MNRQPKESHDGGETVESSAFARTSPTADYGRVIILTTEDQTRLKVAVSDTSVNLQLWCRRCPIGTQTCAPNVLHQLPDATRHTTLHLVVVNGNFTKCRLARNSHDANNPSERDLNVSTFSCGLCRACAGLQLIHQRDAQTWTTSGRRRSENISQTPNFLRFYRSPDNDRLCAWRSNCRVKCGATVETGWVERRSVHHD
jgi:hypothetical protein